MRFFYRLIFFGLMLSLGYIRSLAKLIVSAIDHLLVIFIRDGDRLGFSIVKSTAPGFDNLAVAFDCL